MTDILCDRVELPPISEYIYARIFQHCRIYSLYSGRLNCFLVLPKLAIYQETNKKTYDAHLYNRNVNVYFLRSLECTHSGSKYVKCGSCRHLFAFFSLCLQTVKMIKAILVFNNHGKPRMSRFYQFYVRLFQYSEYKPIQISLHYLTDE